MSKLFRILFLFLFVVFLLPTVYYFVVGFPEFLVQKDFGYKLWFGLHIVSGTVVYVIAPFQLSASMKKGISKQHPLLGRVFLVASLVCILSLYLAVLPNSLCKSCIPSQYATTTLWLLFLVFGFYSIRKQKIIYHQRFMMSAFICAAYFVTVRVINLIFMGFFRWITPNEHWSLLVSDVSVWFVPLLIVWVIWWRKDYNRSKSFIIKQEKT
ncbi:DUF2306 domain-containing protein [Flavobacterium sp. UBA6135]|uniref:DUF2306 domain-containing protein n=1 Tax=Flavobacterium sp. UBA6135 TaxID=1946553 RepID=UPI0025C1CBEC|nr:DUF2306 domain-containing protein [Flavobacterium sp. UBA6135]